MLARKRATDAAGDVVDTAIQAKKDELRADVDKKITAGFQVRRSLACRHAVLLRHRTLRANSVGLKCPAQGRSHVRDSLRGLRRACCDGAVAGAEGTCAAPDPMPLAPRPLQAVEQDITDRVVGSFRDKLAKDAQEQESAALAAACKTGIESDPLVRRLAL